MPLDPATQIQNLNPAWPLGTDPKSEGDDQIRGIKTCLKNSLPNMTGPWATTSQITAAAATVDGALTTRAQVNALIAAATAGLKAPQYGAVSSGGGQLGGSSGWSVTRFGSGTGTYYELFFGQPSSGVNNQSLVASGFALDAVAGCAVTYIDSNTIRVTCLNGSGTVGVGGFSFVRHWA